MKNKSIICMLLSVCIFLSGCGAGNSQQKEGSKEKMVDETVQVYVTPVPADKEELIKRYPDWFDQDGNIVYSIKPGSKTYKKIYNKYYKKKTGADGVMKQVMEEVDMPKDLVDRLDTDTLLQAVEDSPFLVQFGIYNTLEIALECESGFLYGMEVLLKREDAYRAAYQAYTEREVKASGEQSMEDAMLITKILLEQHLLFQKHGYDRLSTEERENVRKAVQRNREEEQKIEDEGVIFPPEDENAKYNFDAILNQEGNPWKEFLEE